MSDKSWNDTLQAMKTIFFCKRIMVIIRFLEKECTFLHISFLMAMLVNKKPIHLKFEFFHTVCFTFFTPFCEFFHNKFRKRWEKFAKGVKISHSLLIFHTV